MKRKQKLILKLFIIPLVFITLPLRFIVQAQNEDASPAAEEVQRKVQEKILKASQKPKAYIGTVTDISENTIQISKFSLDNSQKKTKEVFQISFTSSTAFIDAKTTAKEIKSQDLAIGDFIVAMGFIKNNNILESSRILSLKPLEPSSNSSFKLKVKETNKDGLKVVETAGQKEYSVKIDKNSRIFDQNRKEIKLTAIKTDEEIIVIGQNQDNLITVRTVFLLIPTNQ